MMLMDSIRLSIHTTLYGMEKSGPPPREEQRKGRQNYPADSQPVSSKVRRTEH